MPSCGLHPALEAQSTKDFAAGMRQTSESGTALDECAYMNADTDGALAGRAAAEDRDAFAALVERHYERIYRVGARVLGNEDEAADLAQDVCVGLIAKLPSYRGDSRFTTWLYRVVVNAARDRLRRDGARRRNERAFAEIDSMTRAGEAERENDAVWLRQVLGALTADLRATVILVIEEGLRHAEAAEVLGVTESTVSWRMHEARNRLRALIADNEVMP